MQKKNEPVRIQKILSESGVMSRRKAEDYIEKGKVTVNGRKAVIGQKIDPVRDIIGCGRGTGGHSTASEKDLFGAA